MTLSEEAPIVGHRARQAGAQGLGKTILGWQRVHLELEECYTLPWH